MIRIRTALVIASLFALPALAEDPKGAHGDHPCKKIHAACEAAGYTKGGHKDKKGLFVDCMKPIMSGTKVEGVSIDAATVAACKDRKAKHKGNKGAEDGEE